MRDRMVDLCSVKSINGSICQPSRSDVLLHFTSEKNMNKKFKLSPLCVSMCLKLAVVKHL